MIIIGKKNVNKSTGFLGNTLEISFDPLLSEEFNYMLKIFYHN